MEHAGKQPHAAAAYGGGVENAIAVEVPYHDVLGVGVGTVRVEDGGLEGAIPVAQRDEDPPGSPAGIRQRVPG